jgi:hypothetical protein
VKRFIEVYVGGFLGSLEMLFGVLSNT